MAKPLQMAFKGLILTLGCLSMGYMPTKALGAIVAQIKPIVGVALEPHYTDKEIVAAIYLAEGGDKAQYPYGIKEVHCATKLECKRCCEATVRNNRVRFAKYGYQRFATYLEWLQNRYCPTRGRALTKREIALNGNWLTNVRYFLKQGRKHGTQS